MEAIIGVDADFTLDAFPFLYQTEIYVGNPLRRELIALHLQSHANLLNIGNGVGLSFATFQPSNAQDRACRGSVEIPAFETTSQQVIGRLQTTSKSIPHQQCQMRIR
jgi:hypothetical protein